MRFFPYLSLICLIGCNFNDPIECFDRSYYVDIGVTSSFRIDSIEVSAENKLVCHNDYALLYAKQPDETFFYWVENDCDSATICEKWYSLGCQIGPDENIGLRTFDVTVFNADTTQKLSIEVNGNTGTIYNIIPEQDTAKWFTYENNPTRESNEGFETPAKSVRLGCEGGYCIANVPLIIRQFCRDK